MHEPYLRRIVACTSLGNFAGAISGAVLVIYVLRTLDLDTAAYGAILSASAVGGLLGAVVAGRLAQRIGEGRVIPLSALVMAPAAALTPLAALSDLPAPAVLIVGRRSLRLRRHRLQRGAGELPAAGVPSPAARAA